MEIIEIRQSKNKLIPMLALLTAALFCMIYYLYFSGKFDNNKLLKTIYALFSVPLIYAIYLPTKKFFRNEPVLTFSGSEIEINEKGKPISFLWQQVIVWKIEKEDDGGTHYLKIETAEKTRKINISFLDKKPGEIEELLQKYKGK